MNLQLEARTPYPESGVLPLDYPIVRQCALLGVSRSSFYYRPKAASEADLSLMGEMDRQHLETPFYGSRRMKAWLDRQGIPVSRKRVRRLMRVMGLRAIYRRPRTSQPAPGHRVYPYLLRNPGSPGPTRSGPPTSWLSLLGGRHGRAQPPRGGL